MKNLLIILLIISPLYTVDIHGNQQFLKQDTPAQPAPLAPGQVDSKQVIEMRMNNKPSKEMTWQKYFDAKVIANEVDYLDIEKLLLEVQLDNKSTPTLLPYQNWFKVGAGYNVEDNSMRASPFISEILYNSEPHSFEGTDGTITQAIYTSAKDFAMDISLKTAGKYKGFGVKAAASFSMDASYSIQSNEVVLKATHTIDHGKSIYTQNHLKLTKEAKTSLATDQQEFINSYGTHFIIGYTKECEMNVYYRRKTSATDKKMDVAMAMSVDTKFWDAAGSLDVSVAKKEKEDKTTVQVKYTGTSGDKYIQGLNMQQLQAAILEFPDHCDGNIANYILWPYSALSDYQSVLSSIRVTKEVAAILEAEEEARIRAEEEAAALAAGEALEEAEAAEELERQQAEANVLETPTDAVAVLDRLYTAAILEVKIIKNSINQIKAYNTHQSQLKKDRVFELDLYEMALYDQYQKFKDVLERSDQRLYDIKKLRVAKAQIDSGRIEVLNRDNGRSTVLDAIEEHKKTLEEDQCDVYLCGKCTALSNARCEVCEEGSTLTSDGQCYGWLLLFRQTAPTFRSSEDWLNYHDTEHGKYLDNYSILDKLDDTMRNKQYRFEFLMRWRKDYEYNTYQSWEQLTNPVESTAVRGFQLHENSNFTDHWFAGLVKNEGSFSLMKAAGAPDDLTDTWKQRAFSIGVANAYEGMLPGPRSGYYVSTDGHNCRTRAGFECDICQGHCDDATQCAGKLSCFVRGGNQAVTGCKGATGFVRGINFCYDPQHKSRVQSVELMVRVGRGEGVAEGENE